MFLMFERVIQAARLKTCGAVRLRRGHPRRMSTPVTGTPILTSFLNFHGFEFDHFDVC
jgi:hypothetical protein